MTELHKVGPFVLGRTLGKGVTGTVKIAHHTETGYPVAIKIIKNEFIAQKPGMKGKIEREIAILKLMRHENVLLLLDVYRSSRYLFLILEYMEGGELYDYLKKKGKLSTEESQKIFLQIVKGVSYCHKNLVCHRDLKPENILLDHNQNAKVVDFGMASLMREGNCLLNTSCGSPHYASPEVIKGLKYDGRKADVWSLGVILYVFSTGNLPFNDTNIRQLLGKVKSGIFCMPTNLDSDLKDLLWSMLTVEPEKRISLENVKKHCWFTKNRRSSGDESDSDKEDEDKFSTAELIEHGDVDEALLEGLRCLGWDDEKKLRRELESPDNNSAKVCYKLLKEKKETIEQFKKRGEHVQETVPLPMKTDAPPMRANLRSSDPIPINPRLPQVEDQADSPIIGSSPRKFMLHKFFGSS